MIFFNSAIINFKISVFILYSYSIINQNSMKSSIRTTRTNKINLKLIILNQYRKKSLFEFEFYFKDKRDKICKF